MPHHVASRLTNASATSPTSGSAHVHLVHLGCDNGDVTRAVTRAVTMAVSHHLCLCQWTSPLSTFQGAIGIARGVSAHLMVLRGTAPSMHCACRACRTTPIPEVAGGGGALAPGGRGSLPVAKAGTTMTSRWMKCYRAGSRLSSAHALQLFPGWGAGRGPHTATVVCTFTS